MATVHRSVTGADVCVAACFTVAKYPWFYGRLKQTSKMDLYNYPINFGAIFTLKHHPMGGADQMK